MSICFDDGLTSQIELAVPVLERHKRHATFYLTTHMRERLTPESRRELIDPWVAVCKAGHEIGNHTRSHPCSTNNPWTVELDRVPVEAMSLEEMAGELDDAQRVLTEQIGVAPATFAYPCGMTFVGRGAECRSYVPLVAERFVVGRTYNDECTAAPLRCDLARVPALRMDNKTAADLIALIDEARESGHWLILVGHTVVHGSQPYSTDVKVLEALLEHVVERESDVWVDTVESVGRHLRSLQQSTAL